MGLGIMYGKTYDTNQAMYYRAFNHYKHRIRREGLDILSKEYGSNVAKREAYQSQVLRDGGWNNDDIQDWLTLRSIQTAITSNNQKFHAEARPVFLSSEDSGPIRSMFEEHAIKQNALYEDAVNRVNWLERFKR
jgi:hypothetical protein